MPAEPEIEVAGENDEDVSDEGEAATHHGAVEADEDNDSETESGASPSDVGSDHEASGSTTSSKKKKKVREHRTVWRGQRARQMAERLRGVGRPWLGACWQRSRSLTCAPRNN